MTRGSSGCKAGTTYLACDLWPHEASTLHWDDAKGIWWLTDAEHIAAVAARKAAGQPLTATGAGPLLDPDCRDGKCGSCVGAPCECPCHGKVRVTIHDERCCVGGKLPGSDPSPGCPGVPGAI